MTKKLWTKLASGAIAASLVIGAAPIARAAESATAPTAATPQATAAEPAVPAPSTPVSGILTDPQGHPVVRFELHFQGRVNPDIFTIHTRAGGSFSIALPPGVYDLRGEHGEIIASGVTVGRQAVSLGHVETPAPLAPTRLFDRQAIGEAIVSSSAPAAARVRPPGGPVGPVAVIPAPHPTVQGGTPTGKAKAPAEVVPMGIEQQLQLPAGTETTTGVPPATGEMAAPPTSAQPAPAMPNTE